MNMLSTSLNGFCFTDVVLTTTCAEQFSGVLWIPVLHVIKSGSLLERLMASLTNDGSLAMRGKISQFTKRHDRSLP